MRCLCNRRWKNANTLFSVSLLEEKTSPKVSQGLCKPH